MNGPITEAAGWTLLHFLWQGAAIGAIFGLFLAVVRKPQARYLAGCLALLAMTAAVAGTFVHHYRLANEGRRAAETERPVVKQMVLVFNQCRPCHPETVAEAAAPPTLPVRDRSGSVQAMPILASESASFQSFALADVSGSNSSGPQDSGATSRSPVCRAITSAVAVPPSPAVPAAPAADPPAQSESDRVHTAIAVPAPFRWLVAGWLLGAIFLALRCSISWGIANRLRPRGDALEESFTHRLRHLAEQVGVTRTVRVLRSAEVAVPTVLGWLRPVILFPAATLAGLSRSQLEAILAHELAHIRRHDVFVNLLQHLLETLLFFHPAVWWVSRKVREEREHCCDDIATAVSGGVVDYARALATLEELRDERLSFGMAADGGSLIARIRRLCGVENPRRIAMVVIPVFLLVGAVSIPLAVLPANGTERHALRPPKTEKVLPLPSGEAVRGLRHLLAKEPEPGIPFEDFTRLARSLSTLDLVALLDEVGLQRSDGYRDWLRNALFAEWAGRDLDATLVYCKENLRNFEFHVRQPVLYAIFRGSRPDDPEEALAYLRSLLDDPRFRLNNEGRFPLADPSADWVKHAHQRVFAEFAALDSERAWTFLPGREPNRPNDAPPLNHNAMASANYSYASMVDGFFSGLPDAATIEKFVQRFGPIGGPGTEHLGIVIAKAWMVHDLQAAQAWAPPARNDPGVANLLLGVDGSAAIQWAKENPREALRSLRADILPAWTALMAHAALAHDAHLAPEIVSVLTPDRMDPAGSFFENAKLSGPDRFPEPGRENRPPDYAARYQSFLQALEHPGFTPEMRSALRTKLDSAFANLTASEQSNN